MDTLAGSRSAMHLQQVEIQKNLAARCAYRASAAPSPSGRSIAKQSTRHQPQVLQRACSSMQQSPAGSDSSKYERILAFVDAHATPVVVESWASAPEPEQPQQPDPMTSWHFSYDEEADEGEEIQEPHMLALAAVEAAALAEAAAATVSTLQASTSSVWSYGSVVHPKPFFYSWDEEAEGSFELATAACSTSSTEAAPADAVVLMLDAAAAEKARRAERRAALHEARHAARASRRMRRAQLLPQLGDLEHMPAWVPPQEQQHSGQRSAASSRYQQLLAFVAGDSAHGQYRKPKRWILTFDEDVHGPDAPETVMGSC